MVACDISWLSSEAGKMLALKGFVVVVGCCSLKIRVCQVGRFSKLALLLVFGGTTYLNIYQMLVPPSLAESHPLHFDFPVLASDRKSGVPANASVDFSFQRQLMIRAGRRGIDWSSGQVGGYGLHLRLQPLEEIV
jgi:hypothetical protein